MNHSRRATVVTLLLALAIIGPMFWFSVERQPNQAVTAVGSSGLGQTAAAEASSAPTIQAASVAQRLVLVDDGSTDSNILPGGFPFTGHWYTYSDETGHIDYPGDDFRSVYVLGRKAREFRGGGQSRWGAGIGFNLRAAGAFDARGYAGLRFDAVSLANAITVRVNISDVNTDVQGDVCDVHSPAPSTACGGDYGMQIALPGSMWESYTILFSDLKLPRWTKLRQSRVEGFRRDAVYGIHFQISGDRSAVTPTFGVAFSNIYVIQGMGG